MVHDGRLKKTRAVKFHSSCMESSLVEAIIGVASWVEECGMTGADEALLEEVFKYSHPEICYFF